MVADCGLFQVCVRAAHKVRGIDEENVVLLQSRERAQHFFLDEIFVEC